MVILIAALSLLATPEVKSIRAQNQAAELKVAEGRYLILLEDGLVQSAAISAAEFDRRPGIEIDQVYDTAFRGFAGEFSDAQVLALMSDPTIAGVYPDYLVRTQAQTLEPGIDRVDADLNETKAGNGSGTVDIDVAVIDSGVGPNNDINLVGGYNCMGDGYMRDYYGHGTHVAGIIGARDNGYGLVGIAPGARIWQVRSLDRYGGGTWSQIICGMEWVAEHAATIEVANMSLGAGNPEYGSGCTSSLAHRAVCAMTNAGVTVVAAACNANMDASTCTPGKYAEVISVSAFAEWDGKPGGKGGCKSTPDGFYGCDDRRASFSNYGWTVDIAAIGVGVRSTLFDNQYGYWSGTSMATPHVTGAAALLIAQEGDMSPARVRERLLLTGMSGPVPGDPDNFPEPILNVASLGPGSIKGLNSARVGDRVTIVVGELIPDTRAIFRLDGEYVGGATVAEDGTAHRTITIPDLPYGTYEINVTNHRKTLTDSFLVRPKLELSATSGQVGKIVSADLTGFGADESVLVTFATGSVIRSMVRVRMSSSGSASTSFVVPPSPRGSHRVTATDSSGHTSYLHFETLPSLSAVTPVQAGAWTAVTIRGFRSGESVDIHWGSATGTVLRTKVLTGNGSGDLNVLIPSETDPGPHSLWAVGNRGTSLRVTVTTFGAAEDPSPSPTLTIAPTATESASTPTQTSTPVSPEPTATSTETSTPVPTETATEIATATVVPTESPIEASTESPTEIPSDTSTVVSTETSSPEA